MRKLHFMPILMAILVFTNCQSQDSKIFMSDKVNKTWETPRQFRTPESVLYDSQRNVLYVSSMGGGAQDKNGRGFISRVGLDGEIKELKWATGLNAPKGMAMRGSVLFVSDIDQLVAISIKTGKIERRWDADGAKFLNDVAMDDAGNVYITDMYANRLYTLNEKGLLDVFSKSDLLKRPNGIYYYKDQIYVGNKNYILEVDPSTGRTRKLKGETGPIDGLVALGNNKFLTTDWKGRLFLHDFSKDHQQTRLLDTREANQNAADMTFIKGKNLAVIPTFSDNRIMAYEIMLEE